MSRPVFRTRNLDPSKRIRVIIDQHDNNNNDLQHLQTPASSIQRCVPQMPFVSGMEREEEAEYHLQNALDAQQRLGSAKIRAVPTPDLYEDPNNVSVYPPSVQLPKQLIRLQPLQLESEYPEYDMDANDIEWFEKWNNCLGLTHLQYEDIIDKLENSSGRTVLQYEEAKTLIKEDEDLLKNVYDFWLERRNTTGKRLKSRLLTERDVKEEKGKHHPYVAFRRRIEKMTTRKNRKNDEQAYMSMLKLRSSFQAVVKLTNMIKVRESIKQQLLQYSLQIFQTRCESSESDDYIFNNNSHSDLIKSLKKSNLNSNTNNNNVLTSKLNRNSSTLATLLSAPPPSSTTSLLHHTRSSLNETNNDNSLEPKVKRMKVSQSSLMSTSATMKEMIFSATMQQQNSLTVSKPSSSSSYSKKMHARTNINNSTKPVSLPLTSVQSSTTSAANSLLLERLSPITSIGTTAAVVISSSKQTTKRRQKQQRQNTSATTNNLLNKKNHRTNSQTSFLLTPFSNDNNINQTDNTAGGYFSSLKNSSSSSSILLTATYNTRLNEDINPSNMYASELSLKTPAMSKNEVTSLFDNNIRRTLFSDLNGRFQNLSNLSTVTNTLTPTINSEMNNSLDTSNPWQFRPKAGCSYLKPLSCEHLHTHIKHQFTNDKKHAYYSICCSTHGQIGRSRLRIGRGGRLLYDRRLPKESNELSSETKSHLAEKRILWRMPAKPDLTDDYKLHNHLTINNHDFDLSRKKFTNKSHTIIRVFNNTLMSLHSETNDSSYSVHKPSISTAGKFCPSFSSTNASVSAEEIDQSFIELDHPYSCTSKRITQALQTLTSTSELPSTPSSTILSPLCLCIDTPPTPPSTDPENDRSKAFTLPPTTSNMYNYPTTPPSVNHPNDTSTDSSNTNLTDSKLSTLLAFGSGQSLSLHSRFKNELLNNKNMRLFPSTSSTTTSENNISLLSSTAYAQLEQQQQIYNTTSSSSNNNNLLLNQMLTTALSNRLATVQPNLTSFSRSVSQTDSSSSHTNFPSIQPTTSTTSHFLLRVPAPGSINNQYNNLATNTPSKSSLFNSTTTNHRNVVIPSTTNETKNVLLPAPFTLFQHKTTNGYNGSISSFVAPTVKLSPIDSSSMITEVT